MDKMKAAGGSKATEKQLRAKIPLLTKRGGRIPRADRDIHPDISLRDFLYYMALKQKLIGRLARMG